MLSRYASSLVRFFKFFSCGKVLFDILDRLLMQVVSEVVILFSLEEVVDLVEPVFLCVTLCARSIWNAIPVFLMDVKIRVNSSLNLVFCSSLVAQLSYLLESLIHGASHFV